jgi:threonyl-tRNA synthetase
MQRKSHQEIGRELELFLSVEEAPGMPIFLPNGMIVRNELESLWRRIHLQNGYQEIKTPIMMKQSLWETSGHWEHYHENMYFSEVDEQKMAIKPMNCPGAMLVYNSRRRHENELPLRFAELGHVHRHELSGSLNGLFRVRSFTQDDAHLFVTPEQIISEVGDIIHLVKSFYKRFGFDYKVELSTRPESFMGQPGLWNQAEEALKQALEHQYMPYELNPGDGAFYGPKIDFHIQDSRGRSWQCGTIQLDFQMPEKFGCEYVAADQSVKRPVVIHRAIFGSVERFIGILLEHFDGHLPFWMAPCSVTIVPIAPAHVAYARKLFDELVQLGVRVKIDSRPESLGKRIKTASNEKVPMTVIIGDAEVASGNVNVREKNEQRSISKQDLCDEVLEKFI